MLPVTEFLKAIAASPPVPVFSINIPLTQPPSPAVASVTVKRPVIVPKVVRLVEPVQPSRPSGVTARVASVPVFVSAIVANSTIPATVADAAGSSPVLVPL